MKKLIIIALVLLTSCAQYLPEGQEYNNTYYDPYVNSYLPYYPPQMGGVIVIAPQRNYYRRPPINYAPPVYRQRAVPQQRYLAPPQRPAPQRPAPPQQHYAPVPHYSQPPKSRRG